jgi:hypothetical protein
MSRSQRPSRCTGPRLHRRAALELGAAGLLGLTLPALLRRDALARSLDASAPRPAKAKNVIFYWCQGGPPHQDMWDMKPNAPAEVRGEFSPIASNLPGYQVCELLPQLAQRIHRLTILRGVNHFIPDHNPGSMFMLGSGNPPNPTTFHPTWSAVAKKEFPECPGIPTAVAIPNEPSEGPGPGFLGAAYRSFSVQGDPLDADFRVRSLSLPAEVDLARFERRRALLSDTNRYFDQLAEHRPDVLAGFDKFYQDAYQIVLSERTRQAFHIDQERPERRDRFGRTKLGQRMLLARRLIEAGVRFVTISEPTGWDTHDKNFPRMREQLPVVDQAVSALLDDLVERGLFEDTLFMMFGEFGRTPTINKNGGRDHWPQAMAIVLAGGGVPGGLIYGATDQQAAYVVDKSHSPADFACTIYTLLGIDPHREYLAGNGQPTPIVRGGEPIRAICG